MTVRLTVSTGSGKTSYYIMYILVVLAVSKNPSLCITTKFPQNPCLIVICPTIPLQLEMVSASHSNHHTSRQFTYTLLGRKNE
jgi:hypothetical protein